MTNNGTIYWRSLVPRRTGADRAVVLRVARQGDYLLAIIERTQHVEDDGVSDVLAVMRDSPFATNALIDWASRASVAEVLAIAGVTVGEVPPVRMPEGAADLAAALRATLDALRDGDTAARSEAEAVAEAALAKVGG